MQFLRLPAQSQIERNLVPPQDLPERTFDEETKAPANRLGLLKAVAEQPFSADVGTT